METAAIVLTGIDCFWIAKGTRCSLGVSAAQRERPEKRAADRSPPVALRLVVVLI